MFNHWIEQDDALYIPMIDARRMEVYTAIYDASLHAIVEPQAMILNEQTVADLPIGNHPLVVMGNGSDKARQLFADIPNASFIADVKPVAIDMMALSEKAYREQAFADVAYSTPLYLKEFQVTKSKKDILGNHHSISDAGHKL